MRAVYSYILVVVANDGVARVLRRCARVNPSRQRNALTGNHSDKRSHSSLSGTTNKQEAAVRVFFSSVQDPGGQA
jgi:hypothetical protein